MYIIYSMKISYLTPLHCTIVSMKISYLTCVQSLYDRYQRIIGESKLYVPYMSVSYM